QLGQDARHVGGGGGEVGEDLLDADFRLVAAAGGKVRHQCQAGIVQLQFARQYGLGHAGHADQVATVALHAGDLGTGFQPRPLGGPVAAAVDGRHAGRTRRIKQLPSQRFGIRLAEVDVFHLGAFDVAVAGEAAVGVVDQLVGYHDYPRTHVVADAADGIDADHPPRAQAVQRPHVGAVVDPVWRQRVALAVAGEEGDALAGEVADHDVAGGRAVGRVHRVP